VWVAVNAFARINVPFGGALTKVAELPKGARRILDDPFAVKRRPYEAYAVGLFLLVVTATWAAGRPDGFLPDDACSTAVLHRVLRGLSPSKSP
jgi:hypothetical protein